MKRILLVSALALGMMSCDRSPSAPAERPGTGGEQPVVAEPDYSSEKADATPRAVVAGEVLKADATGVLYITTGEEYSFVRLDDGYRVDFNPQARTLRVAGVSRQVDGVTRFHSTTTRDWWAVTAPSDTAIIVTEIL